MTMDDSREPRPPIVPFQLEEGDDAYEFSDVPLYPGGSRPRSLAESMRTWPWKKIASIAVVVILFLIVVLAVSAARKSKSSSNDNTINRSESANMCSPQDSDPFRNFKWDSDHEGKPRAVEVEHGAVAAQESKCSNMGVDILKKGGNAVDALVTTTLCQGILNPTTSGTGGGSFAVIRMSDGRASVVDAREYAPSAATWDMFNGTGQMASLNGGKAVGVPLELKGLELAHKTYGRLEWHTLFDPVYDIAEKGFEVYPSLSDALARVMPYALAHEPLRKVFYAKDGDIWRPPRVGEMCCKRPGLAKSLRKAANDGVDALYEDIAQSLVDEMNADSYFKGIMTVDDIMKAKPAMKEPLRANVFGMEVLGMPLPSSSAAVISAMKLLDILEWPEGDLLQYHWLVEACETMFALRTHLGYPMPDTEEELKEIVKTIMDDDFVQELKSKLDKTKTLDKRAYGGRYNISAGIVPEDHGTCHISIVDKDRNAVSSTSTINTYLGSLVYSESTGIILNNQMDDFSRPDTPNFFGLPPSVANYIAPGKKPLSSMSPMIFVKDGKVREVVGGSGGSHIMTSVLQTAFRTLKLNMDPRAAVLDLMLHPQLIPESVVLETIEIGSVNKSMDSKIKDYLKAKGNKVVDRSNKHAVQLITVDPETNKISAVSDPRKDAAPAGY